MPASGPHGYVPGHSIFRDHPTPTGTRFAQWLANRLHLPHPRNLPGQMRHQVSVLGGYSNEDEVAVRKVQRRALVERTTKGLGLFWEIWRRNRVMLVGQDGEW
jgi:hypothetical protein